MTAQNPPVRRDQELAEPVFFLNCPTLSRIGVWDGSGKVAAPFRFELILRFPYSSSLWGGKHRVRHRSVVDRVLAAAANLFSQIFALEVGCVRIHTPATDI